MAFRADILVQSPDNRPIAVVEVKNRQNLSRKVATILRRNLMAHNLLYPAPYFLLLSQDSGFLWKETQSENLDAPPTLEFPMDKVVSRYLPEMGTDERLRGAELEILVLRWLNDLIWMQRTLEEPEKSLASFGFLEAIQGATVTTEASLYDRVR